MAKAQELALTYEDYLTFPSDGKRYEIVEGELFVTPAPFLRHQSILGALHRVVSNWCHATQSGQVFLAPTDVYLSSTSVVQPDLLFVSAEHRARLGDRFVDGAPDLVVEVLSESTRRYDEITKRNLYASFGVPEYWVVDPELWTIKVYRLVSRRYERISELSAENEDVLTSPQLLGFKASLAELFAAVRG